MQKLMMGVAAAALFAPAAMAADLGGNCCVDLEERVAELEATTARKGNRLVSLEVSGHVNAAILWTDIDGLDDANVIDNNNSQSRFRFKGSAKISQEWEAGFLMEFGASGVEFDGSPTVRHQALYLKHHQMGTVWLGKTSTATDAIMELSLASSDASTLGSLSPLTGVIENATGLGIGNPFDGSRAQVVRYISPNLAGFNVSAAWIDQGDSSWDVALRYAGEFGAIRVAAGVGYRKEDISADVVLGPSGGDREFIGGSGSIMHVPTGIFLDAQYGRSDGLQTVDIDLNKLIPILAFQSLTIGTEAELKVYGGRFGVAQKWNRLGKTTGYFEYSKLELDDTGIDPTLYGVGLVQDVDAAAMSIYFSYRHIDLDLGGDGDDADVFLVGSKIRF
jgi:hypothetical protein